MNNDRVLSALCYFSIFFSPLLLPGIVFFVTDEQEVKHHAKRAFVSHLVPVVVLISGFLLMYFSFFTFESRVEGIISGSGGFDFWSFAPLLFMLLYGVLSLAVIVWNVYHGVKVLK